MSEIKLGELVYHEDKDDVFLENIDKRVVGNPDAFYTICPKCSRMTGCILQISSGIFSKSKIIMKCKNCNHQQFLY